MSDKEHDRVESDQLAEFWFRYSSALKTTPQEPPFFLSDVVSGGNVLFPDDQGGIVQQGLMTLPAGVGVQVTKLPDGTWQVTATPSASATTNGTVRLILSGLPRSENAEDSDAVAIGTLALRGAEPAQYDFGPLEKEFGPNYRGFSWSAVFVHARERAPKAVVHEPEAEATRPTLSETAAVGPEALADQVFTYDFLNSGLVPPSDILSVGDRRAIFHAARMRVDEPRMDESMRRDFLLACAKRIRKVARDSALRTGFSGETPDKEARGRKELNLINCQSELLDIYEQDEFKRQAASWFRLYEDAGLGTEEISDLFNVSISQVENAVSRFISSVNDVLRSSRLS